MFCILSSQGTERRERLKNANPHLLIVAPKGPPIPSNTLSFNTLQYPLQLVLMGPSSALPDPAVMFPYCWCEQSADACLTTRNAWDVGIARVTLA